MMVINSNEFQRHLPKSELLEICIKSTIILASRVQKLRGKAHVNDLWLGGIQGRTTSQDYCLQDLDLLIPVSAKITGSQFYQHVLNSIVFLNLVLKQLRCRIFYNFVCTEQKSFIETRFSHSCLFTYPVSPLN